MNFTDLDVLYLGSRAWGHKPSCHHRNHFMTLIGKNLPRPPPHAAADKNKACKADSRTCYQACKAKRDPKGEEDWPRRASRHFDRPSSALFGSLITHNDSPANEVNNCEHHDPHAIHEVPIEGNYAKAFTLPRVNPTK